MNFGQIKLTHKLAFSSGSSPSPQKAKMNPKIKGSRIPVQKKAMLIMAITYAVYMVPGVEKVDNVPQVD